MKTNIKRLENNNYQYIFKNINQDLLMFLSSSIITYINGNKNSVGSKL